MTELATAPRYRGTEDWPRMAVLGLTLVLCCVLGLITPYLLIIVSIVIAARTAMQARLGEAWHSTGARLFLLAFAIIAACFALTAQAPGDVLYAFNFIMLPLFGPITLELARGGHRGNGRRIAQMALAGTVLALAMALFRLMILGEPRADSLMFGAILLGNTAILLGFLSLAGLLIGGQGRWVFALGPFVGVLVNALTGSRGPLLGLFPLILFATLFLGWRLRWKPYVILLITMGCLGISVGIVLLTQSRAASILEAFGTMFMLQPTPEVGADGSSGAALDGTANIRLVLWRAGYAAFLEAPWFGHGWARLMAAIVPHLSPEHLVHARLPHLHNDIINFAVAGGIVGIAAYLLLLVTPIAAAWRSPRDSLFHMRLYGCAVLVISYFFAGLTDLMFGFEFHTAIYVCLSAILLGYCREERAPEAP
jgi:O-antigen ligase